MRETTKTYTLPDKSLVIEKGQKIFVPMFSIHRDPKYYPDPLKFDPERFSVEQKSQRPNGTYMPFGDGPRLCIGNVIVYGFIVFKYYFYYFWHRLIMRV